MTSVFNLALDVFDYRECFYNPKRRHLTLGGISPVNLKKAMRSKLCVHDFVGNPNKCTLDCH
ncbi:IS3 family transposase [Methylophaga thiooxydans]|uniref:IS3 family transposase n=1 Tax=Methylophaga thiooxydans TaxID=392484 RepID=UPI003872D481